MTFSASLPEPLRYARQLRSFFDSTISLAEARAAIEHRLAAREANFLHVLERGIYNHPSSPYLALLKLARCDLGDISAMLRRRGLQATLTQLRREGVYVSFEEFKGRTPIVRGGKVISVKATAFDNPQLRQGYRAESGGTTGAATQLWVDLHHLADCAQQLMVTEEAHGLRKTPTAIWYGVLPDSTGLQSVLIGSRFGHIAERWFSPNPIIGLRRRIANGFVVAMGRSAGKRLPWPESLALDNASTVARWAVEAVATHGACLVRTHVSKALRVCVAAQENGWDLTGTTFFGGGEPPTDAKVDCITHTGARLIPVYWMTEAGCIGQGCAHPVDDLHFFKDGMALIQHPRNVAGFGVEVDAFHLTTLLSSAPRLFLNVETDDYGIVEQRSCGCALESYGLTDHLREIRSFSKLTAEGVTLVGSGMVRILEEVLPGRFGGNPLDYQIVEEEDERGFTRLTLLVSPRVALVSESAAVEVVLEALASIATDADRAIWRQARTLRVRRQEPIWTARGKLMPLHIMKKPD
jgi:hypothetical protein